MTQTGGNTQLLLLSTHYPLFTTHRQLARPDYPSC